MIDYEILESFGTNDTALRALFVREDDSRATYIKKLCERKKIAIEAKRAEKLDNDSVIEGKHELSEKEFLQLRSEVTNKLDKRRNAWTKRIQSRVEEGRRYNYKDFRFYLSSDLAWDGKPIVSETIPLTLYAQNKLDVQSCAKQLDEILGSDRASSFITKDPEGKVSINLPKFQETTLNVVRPLVTRRVAAQANKYVDLYPFFKFESRSKTPTGNLRADVLSQRVEIITDQYGYRHDFPQVLRKTFIHGWAVSFIESAWDREKQYRKNVEGNIEEVTTKEGINFVHPHPTRIFYDRAYPLSSLNFDSGISYVGYWDLIKQSDLESSAFFNREYIRDYLKDNYSNKPDANAKSFYDTYYPDTIVYDTATQHAMKNMRDANTGRISSDAKDQTLFLTIYFEKIVPKDEGIGDYPHPVWLRLIVANDDTVVSAEILPSTPGAYMGYNQDDGRLLNLSMAHEIIPYQDQLENLMSQLIHLMRLESILIMAVDSDMIEDDMRKQLKDFFKNGRHHHEALIAEYSSKDQRELLGASLKETNPITFNASNLRSQIADTFNGITQLLSILERNQLLSPQELGQFSQRQTSASEVVEVSNTTNSLYGFISQGPDEYRAAVKKLLYGAFMAKGKDEVFVPIVSTYPNNVITSSGFVPVEDISEVDNDSNISEETLITGSKTKLIHDYIFNSRDGAERTMNAQASTSIFQFLSAVMGNEILMRAIGQEQLFEMISESFRLLGTTMSLKLDPDAQGGITQTDQAIQQLSQQIQQLAQQQSSGEEAIQQVAQQLEVITQEHNAMFGEQ